MNKNDETKYSLCKCGCGNETKLSNNTDNRKGYIKGKPRRFLLGHNSKNIKYHPTWRGGNTIKNSGYCYVHAPEHPYSTQDRYVPKHRLVVESVLGKFLNPKNVVHHINEDMSDNKKNNLLVCEDTAYHNFMHRRLRALKLCGNSRWIKCPLCKQYDDPVFGNMYVSENGYGTHRECHNEYERTRRLRAAWRKYELTKGK